MISHAIMGISASARLIRPFAEIQAAYKESDDEGVCGRTTTGWTNATNRSRGTQTWFWSNYEFMHGETRVQTPEDLQRYDPKLYELLSRVYADHHISMDVYHGKNIQPRRRPQ